MILSYRDRRTERFATGEFVQDFQAFETQAERRLAILNAAPSLRTLAELPGNRLGRCGETVKDSIRFESTVSGVSVFRALMAPGR